MSQGAQTQHQDTNSGGTDALSFALDARWRWGSLALRRALKESRLNDYLLIFTTLSRVKGSMSGGKTKS